jgi:glycosyltransferase involved in cell wall biosynthesis
MKVLMFGWEFAPIYSGGLGVACAGLTKGLVKHGANITFVIPKKKGDIQTHVNLVSASEMMDKIKTIQIDSPLKPYLTSSAYSKLLGNRNEFSDSLYGQNLFDEVHRYSEAAKEIARQETFDVIHSHDWMTFNAGINAKKVSGKPLLVHVHATEFDRTGGNGVNQHVYEMEKEGMHAADKVITVSNYTKNLVMKHYGIPSEKIEVVHNAVDFDDHCVEAPRISENDKIVLFLGRITLQKGPDYFVEMAKKVADIIPEAKFVVAGSGDMEARMIMRAAELGIGDRMLFAGFLRGDDIDRAYKMADVYVMPSVSEPFGITPLEAIKNGTPAIISKQSGVSEILNNTIKVDFWDIDKMANLVAGILKYSPLRQTMSEEGLKELQKISWDNSARKCIDVYNQVMR